MRQAIPKRRAWHKYDDAAQMTDTEFTQRVDALKREFGDHDESN